MAKEISFTEAKAGVPDETGLQRWASWLLSVVDACLAGCIFIVPLLLGGRCAVGHFGLTIFAATAASVWWLRQSLLPRQYWRRSAAHLLLLAAIALVVLQLAPLPGSWTSQLSPKTAELLPLWNENGSAGLDAWHQVSLIPAESRSGLVLLLAYGLVFSVSVQRIRSMEDVERLLRWTAYSAVGMGLFGLLQYFTSNGMFFWVYQHPFAMTDDGVKGAFTNRNHFAHFLALGIGPVIWWVQDGMRRHGMGGNDFVRMKGVRNRAADVDMGLRVAGAGRCLPGSPNECLSRRSRRCRSGGAGKRHRLLSSRSRSWQVRPRTDGGCPATRRLSARRKRRLDGWATRRDGVRIDGPDRQR